MDPGSTFFTAISHTTIAEEKMKIPPAIAPSMRALSTNPVILRDRYRNLWPVEVAKDRGGMYFGKGWMKLCEEYSLESGDTMVFEYRGNNMFDFKLLGINACEKEFVGGLKFTVKEEEEEEEAEEEEEEDDTEAEEEDDDTELEDSYNEDEDYVENEEEHEDDDDDDDEQDNTSRKVNLKSKSKTNHAGRSSLNRGPTSNPTSSSFNYLVHSSHIHVFLPNYFVNGGGMVSVGAATSPKKGKYKNSKVHDWYAADLFKSGVAPQPKNPYFVSKSRAENRFYELYIPSWVIKDFKLKIPDELYLVDANGRKWGTKIKKWGDGRVWIGRGWKSLCNANLIDKDDLCICEFVQEEGNDDLNILVKAVGK